jgi:hypothetical protein
MTRSRQHALCILAWRTSIAPVSLPTLKFMEADPAQDLLILNKRTTKVCQSAALRRSPL